MNPISHAWSVRFARIAMLLLVECCGITHASAQSAPLAQGADAPGAWTCQYLVTPRDGWFVRCYELAALVAYDPVADQGNPIVWDVPLWGPPMSDDRTAELVRAVLCDVTRSCAVNVMQSVAIARRGDTPMSAPASRIERLFRLLHSPIG